MVHEIRQGGTWKKRNIPSTTTTNTKVQGPEGSTQCNDTETTPPPSFLCGTLILRNGPPEVILYVTRPCKSEYKVITKTTLIVFPIRLPSPVLTS